MASSDPLGPPAAPARGRRARPAAAAVVAALSLAGCSHSSPSPPAPSPGFDNEKAKAVSCLAHQTQHPDPRYTGGASGDTGHILLMLQYYTANGDKPFCDKARPTATDLDWAKLYVKLGGNSTKVARILHST